MKNDPDSRLWAGSSVGDGFDSQKGCEAATSPQTTSPEEGHGWSFCPALPSQSGVKNDPSSRLWAGSSVGDGFDMGLSRRQARRSWKGRRQFPWRRIPQVGEEADDTAGSNKK